MMSEGQIFFKLCPSNEIPEGKSRCFFFADDNDMQITVFRSNGKLYALHNICPHKHVAKIHKDIIHNHNVTCPKHGLTFLLGDGKNISKRQGTKGLRTFKIVKKNGYIFLKEPALTTAKWKTA
jgi:nitrite reductase/ring-hydroxylating ferredoxin subunit